MFPPPVRRRSAFPAMMPGAMAGALAGALLMAAPAGAVTAWDFARSAAPIIGEAEACGVPPPRIAAADATLRHLLDLSADDADDHRKVLELFDFMRQTAITLHQRGTPADGGREPDCTDAAATFADLEARLPNWQDLAQGMARDAARRHAAPHP